MDVPDPTDKNSIKMDDQAECYCFAFENAFFFGY